MEFKTDRISQLAGISSDRKKASGIMSEARLIEGVDDVPTSDDLDPITEQKLRKAIRKELISMLREMNQQSDLDGENQENSAAATGPGFMRGFGGPGFM